MKCHACGHDNAERALFCADCRRPLVAPTKLPTRLESISVSAAAAGPALEVLPGGIVVDRTPRERYAPPNTASGRGGDQSADLTNEEAWAAVIGDSGTHYYLGRFQDLSRGQGGGWHWPAMLITWYWLLYRKMWLGALIYFFAPGVVLSVIAALLPSAAVPLMILWWIGLFAGPAMMANGWYYRHCQNKIRDVRARGGSKEQMLARLEAVGGTSNIIVIIVGIMGLVAGIGILAAVSLPAYQTYTVKAKVSEAVLVGAEVAAAVGKQYEQTGALPLNSDVERMLSQSSHPSRFVRGVEIEPSTGVLTVKVDVAPNIQGSLEMVPSADGNRHLSWTCTTEDLTRYVPASCRGQAAPTR